MREQLLQLQAVVRYNEFLQLCRNKLILHVLDRGSCTAGLHGNSSSQLDLAALRAGSCLLHVMAKQQSFFAAMLGPGNVYPNHLTLL